MPTTADTLLRLADVRRIVGMPASSVYLLMNNSDPTLRFPRPIKIGQRSRWRASEVQNWINRQDTRTVA